MESQPGPRREDEYERSGFENPRPEQVTQALQKTGSLHSWAGVSIVKMSLGVVAKFGAYVTIGEAKQMQFVAQHTADLPLPRIFGYYRYGPHSRDPDDHGSVFDTYIFMSFVEGEALIDVWDTYNLSIKAEIASQLRRHIEELRKIPIPGYIGSVSRGIVIDPILENASARGPFESEDNFNAALIEAYQQSAPKLYTRAFLLGMLSQQRHRILFAHGDLRPGNIIVRDGKVSGIIDWELSGCYPEYWEFVKSFYSWRWQNDWTDYLLSILDPYYPEFGAYTFIADRLW